MPAWVNRWTVGAVLFIVLVGVGLQLGGRVKDWWLERQVQRQQGSNAEVLREGAKTRDDVATLKAERDAALRRADEAAKRGEAAALESRRLGGKVADLERQRQRITTPRSLQEARDELARMGYGR